MSSLNQYSREFIQYAKIPILREYMYSFSGFCRISLVFTFFSSFFRLLFSKNCFISSLHYDLIFKYIYCNIETIFLYLIF